MTNPFFLVLAVANLGAGGYYLWRGDLMMGLSLMAYVAGAMLQAFGTIK